MTELYDELRPLLFSIAYRMLGSANEAEDIVQEAFLRFHRARSEKTEIESPKAYLSAVTTRLSIDHLRSARVRRETYVGDWLPEPLLTDPEADPARDAETADSLSLAFLVLLERLSPVERAVFLLREVFGYDYAQIARVVGKTEENCRQLVVRARRHVDAGRPRFEASREQRQELARRFFEACDRGDTDGLVSLLAADALADADGGGKAPAIRRTVYGSDRVARFAVGVARKLRLGGFRRRFVEVNGQPGAAFLDAEGRIVDVIGLDIADGQIQAVHSILNPDKLRHLGQPVERD